ncbi:MAG: response regulator, partial [Chloroflexales bacterium]|nr:response regulator [Chloroflexales bacterium]
CLRMVAQIALAKRISLSSAYDSQVQTLVADERRLKQILVNLLANAVKFTPEGGKVGLELRGNAEEQTVTFTVWDTGIGIAAEDLPQLFQPFVQLDSSLSRQHTGTGLGLALVARLTAAHGGSVAVESTPGVGSRFHVTFPWSPAAAPARTAPATTALPATRPAIGQAMVIEDSPTAAEQLTRYLHELGARVEVLPYGTGVIQRTIALQPDVILLDIMLPDDDGWQVLRQLKAEPRTQAIPVIVISVIDQPERARTLGAAASLLKPIQRAVNEHTLHRVLVHQADTSIPLALVATPPTGRPKLLLAEDNEASIAIMFDYLRAKGYDLISARNGSEAVVRSQEERQRRS